MDRSLLIGQSDIVLRGGNDHILGILQEIVGTQIAHVVAGHAADQTGSIGIRHDLVLDGNGIVQFIGIGFVVSKVKQRRNSPVAVEGKIGNAQADIGTALGGKGHKPLHIHAVFKGVIQIALVLLRQGNAQLQVRLFSAVQRQLRPLQGAALSGNDLHRGTLQLHGFLGNGSLTGIGLGLADTLGKYISTDIVSQHPGAEIGNGKGQFIDAVFIGIVPKLQLGLVHGIAFGIIGSDVGIGADRCHQIGKTRTLLPHGIGQSVGIQRHVGCGHHQPVDHLSDLDAVISDLREVLHHVLTQKHNHTCQVGAGHGSTGQAVIGTAGNSRENISAVGRDLRLDLQAGRGAPGGEVGNEGAGGLLLADLQGSAAQSCQHLTVILGDGAHRQFGIAHIHFNIAGYIIIDNNARRSLRLGDQSLLLKGIVTAANQSDLTVHIQTGVVRGTPDTGNHNEFIFLRKLLTQKRFKEVVLLRSAVVGLLEINDGVLIHNVGCLHAVDGGNGKNTVVGGRGTDCAGIGIGGQTQVAVLFGTVSRAEAVGCGNNHADACVPDLVIDAAENLFVTLPAEAGGSTQRHIDHVHPKDHAVLKR